MAMYRWLVYLAFFPAVSLAAFIVDNFTKPALTCEPFLIQWQGGTAPWTLSVLQVGTSELLEDLGTFTVTSFKWDVDLAAGTSVLIQLRDSTGAVATSQSLTIQPGSANCILTTLSSPPPPPPSPSSTSSVTLESKSTGLGSIRQTITFSAARTTSVASSTGTGSRPASSNSQFNVATRIRPTSSISVSNVPPTISLPSPTRTSSLTTASLSIATGSGGFTQSGVGAYSTMLPAQGLSIQKASPVGLILGLLIPGILLLGFFCVFLLRRRTRSAPAGIEELAVKDRQDTPTWFMKTDQPNPWTAYGTPSSGSYRNSYQESEFSSSTRSASVSRVSPYQLPSSRPDSDASSIRFLSLVPPPNAGQRIETSVFPTAPVEPLPPPAL
ncbi:hypothetical protein C8F04DRAFT_1110216 [Mycena alexandri]|uniref:Transmembrane protein n=1 Tax=Mycena alexandri TaxID=1745969 RepID=A0AAD6SR75_9AGAR|nr:hypothetical protein C8F04DRAFT_1110216 [Mycena alexandri]